MPPGSVRMPWNFCASASWSSIPLRMASTSCSFSWAPTSSLMRPPRETRLAMPFAATDSDAEVKNPAMRAYAIDLSRAGM